MNVIIVDTSVWISFFRGKPFDDIEVALQEGRIYLPPIVIAELLSGKLRRNERIELISFLKELPVCNTDFDHWERVGQLRADLFSKGFSISTPDAHVAQCTLDLDGYLASEDTIFQKIAGSTGLRIV